MIRIIVASPIILTGQVLTDIGYRVAGAAHLNPYRRAT